DAVGRPLRRDGAEQVLGKTVANAIRGEDQCIPRMYRENPSLQWRQVAPYDATAEHERLGRRTAAQRRAPEQAFPVAHPEPGHRPLARVERGRAQHHAARLTQPLVAAVEQLGQRGEGELPQRGHREPRRRGRLAAVAEPVHHRHQDAIGEGLDHVAVAVLGLPGERRGGDAPLDGPRGHGSHFFTVTVVPRPTAETMSNSSVSRLTPGSPRPRPPEVEKPLCSARATLGIPGPSSRATTMIPRRLFRSMPFRTIRPRSAYRTMLRASSEIAVAISVRSVGRNPSAAASSRPFWRAKTMSTSERTGIEFWAGKSADARPFDRSAGRRPSGCTAPRRSPRTEHFSSARPLRSL